MYSNKQKCLKALDIINKFTGNKIWFRKQNKTTFYGWKKNAERERWEDQKLT